MSKLNTAASSVSPARFSALNRWRDACLAVVDVKDKANPRLITHKVWAPPFGGGTHNALPLPDRNLLVVVDETVLDNQEDGFKPIWIFDNQVKSNPISISTFSVTSSGICAE